MEREEPNGDNDPGGCLRWLFAIPLVIALLLVAYACDGMRDDGERVPPDSEDGRFVPRDPVPPRPPPPGRRR